MTRVIIISMIFLFACSDRNDELKDAVLKEYLRLRIEFEEIQKDACRAAIIARAEASVDSIILTLDIDPLKDSLYNPLLPDKPSFIPVDSLVFINSEPTRRRH